MAIFSSLYELGFNVNDGILNIVNGFIEVNFTKIVKTMTEPRTEQEPVTAFIFNKDHEILCKDKESTYFSKDCDNALSLYQAMAEELMKKPEYKNCFIVQLKVEPEAKDEFLPIIKFMVDSGNVHQVMH